MDEILDFDVGSLLLEVVAIQLDLKLDFIAFLEHLSPLSCEVSGVDLADVGSELRQELVKGVLEELSHFNFDRVKGPSHVVAVLLAEAV